MLAKGVEHQPGLSFSFHYFDQKVCRRRIVIKAEVGLDDASEADCRCDTPPQPLCPIALLTP